MSPTEREAGADALRRRLSPDRAAFVGAGKGQGKGQGVGRPPGLREHETLASWAASGVAAKHPRGTSPKGRGRVIQVSQRRGGADNGQRDASAEERISQFLGKAVGGLSGANVQDEIKTCDAAIDELNTHLARLDAHEQELRARDGGGGGGDRGGTTKARVIRVRGWEAPDEDDDEGEGKEDETGGGDQTSDRTKKKKTKKKEGDDEIWMEAPSTSPDGLTVSVAAILDRHDRARPKTNTKGRRVGWGTAPSPAAAAARRAGGGGSDEPSRRGGARRRSGSGSRLNFDRGWQPPDEF